MFVSHKWLKRYIPDLDKYIPEQIADAFTSSLADVEHIVLRNAGVNSVVVGEVLTVVKHDKSNKLSICTVSCAEPEARTILCGAPNVAAGQKVAVCLPGGAVNDIHTPGSMLTIAEREIMGTVSQGMICSEKELGLSDNHDGIMVLEQDANVGDSIDDLIIDYIYEIENKALGHRPDCFSHMGLARELAAILSLSFVEPQLDELPIVPTAKLELSIDKKVDNELCPRFSSILLADVSIKPSPLWLKARLSMIGIRPVNNVVDLTNYVMADKGQPMHAYDYDKLASKKLVIRHAKSGEKMTALDGKLYEMDKNAIVITDGKNIEDIAGIMGGAGTQITDETKNVVLEAANFNMYSIRRTSRLLGLRSEASTRFEKGIDPNLTEMAIKTAATLIQDLSGAEVASELLDIYPEKTREREIKLDFSKINRFLGIEISKQKAIDILGNLNLFLKESVTSGVDTNQFQQPIGIFVIPTYRPDLVMDHDLLEEIARIYGFANVKPTIPERDLTPVIENPISVNNRKLVFSLTGLGFDELTTYSFVDEQIYSKSRLDIKTCLELENPLAPELSHMRSSLLASLVKVVSENSREYHSVNIFELGRGVRTELDAKGIHLQPRLCSAAIWSAQTNPNIFFDIKGIVEALLARLNIQADFEILGSSKEPGSAALHPGRSAVIISRQNQNVIGVIGEAHPELLANWELNGSMALFELYSDALRELEASTSYKPLSPYQKVSRDLSFLLPEAIEYAEITKQIMNLGIELIRSVRFVDTFVPADNENQKSITISVMLQSDKRTLTDAEITEVITSVVRVIERNLDGKLRQ